MTFKIDPLGLVNRGEPRIKGPAGPSFADNAAILPSIIAELMEARAAAKRDSNPYLSQAIKILMNSFYGVLGAQGCRFFSTELATTITQTGQYILKQTIEHIHASTPYPVIYGDTDSLFVHLGAGMENKADETGNSICKEVTGWLARTLRERFNVDSALELQFERAFRHFFLPPLRGSTQGSKKHYCGSYTDASGSAKLVFKGMESARSDWTDLAKEFQHELFTALFAGKPIVDYITSAVERVRSGMVDDKLVYKKRLRKQLDEYTVNVPPHVQAARLLDHPGHLIRYYITVNGPQPVEKRSAPPDYEHYIESQLKPIADSILEMQGTSFDKLLSGQQELFM
jgi:DNA polymerase-2